MSGRSAPPWLHASLPPRARWRRWCDASFGQSRARLRAWQEVARWFRPKSVIEASASMARIIKPPNCKTVADLQRAVMEWELRVVEHEGWFNEQILESLKVAALRRMLTLEMAER